MVEGARLESVYRFIAYPGFESPSLRQDNKCKKATLGWLFAFVRLGVSVEKGHNVPRHVDGLLDIMDDAVNKAADALPHERLQGWQAALFPTGFSGMAKILVGAYREHAEPMRIVGGRTGREQVHFEAPPSSRVPAEMDALLDWFNARTEQDTLVQAALAHLWFETIHPFEDGNGRVGRVIIDLVLARDSGEASRLMRIRNACWKAVTITIASWNAPSTDRSM